MSPSSTNNAPEHSGHPPAVRVPEADGPVAVGEPRTSQTPERSGFMAGRSGLVVPLVLAGISTYLVYGIVTMSVPEDTEFPGPRFYPLLLTVAGYVLALLLVLEVVRKPSPPDESNSLGVYRFHSDWTALAWLVGGFLVFSVGLEFLGWIIAAALLFWCVARGVGSRRPLFDISLSLVVSSLIYLAFAVGLGLNLPSGLLGGL